MNTQALIGVKGSWTIGSRNCPVQAYAWTSETGTPCFQGTLSVRSLEIHDLLKTFDASPGAGVGLDFESELLEVVDKLVGPLSMDVDVLWMGEHRSFGLATRWVDFRFVRRSTGSAVVMRLAEGAQTSSNELDSLLTKFREFQQAISLNSLILAYRRRQGVPLSDLTGTAVGASLPPSFPENGWLLCSQFIFGKDSISASAMKSLLGIEELDFCLGMGKTDSGTTRFAASLSIPAIHNKILTANNLYILFSLEGGSPSFELHGSLEFAFLDGVTFTVDSSFTTTAFSLSAEMQIETKAYFTRRPDKRSIFDLFTVENIGVLIGYDAGLTFGVFASITVCQQMVFGAAILTLEGEIPVPRLVSGAIDPISLPTLFANATGSHIDGLDAFDILSIDRFDDIKLQNKFRQEDLKKRDGTKVAESFNGNVALASCPLDANALQIRPRKEGYGLVDQKRMRHYFIDGNGQIFLQPQFYVSEIETNIGGYSVKPGVFLAGKITVLGKSFEVVFSMSEDSGILAYARLDPIEFKIGTFTVFQVCASKDPMKDSTKNPIALPEKNPISQFVPKDATGLVFYLSASKKDVTFYFDGHLEFLTLFKFDARIVYCSRKISVHAVIEYWGIRVFVLLDADYSNLISKDASLTVKLQLDTAELTSKLDAVTKALDEAIQKLKTTMSSAQGSLDSAQRNVDQLRGQITHMDDLIRSCRKAIGDAHWWKKAFVAIAKGAEIGLYEATKAGIWTAIGIATAALQVAKLAVAAFGNLSVGLLQLVNATIRAATSLLFLRSAEISADISAQSKEFRATINFVALGQEYSFVTKVDLNILKDGLIEHLSETLKAFLKIPMENVSNGKPAGPGGGSNSLLAMSMLSTEMKDSQDAPSEEIPDIYEASTEVSRLSSILLYMQTRYREEFGEDLAEFSSMNTAFATALNVSGNAMATASQASDSQAFKDLAKFVGEQDMGSLDSPSRETLESAVNDLNDSIRKHAATKAAIDATETVKSQWAARPAAPSPKQSEEGTTSEEIDGKMADFLEELEREIHEKYPSVFRETGYIDLSQEQNLRGYFRAAKDQTRPDLEVMDAMRWDSTLRTAAPGYRARL